jgi:hypothetical protein
VVDVADDDDVEILTFSISFRASQRILR